MNSLHLYKTIITSADPLLLIRPATKLTRYLTTSAVKLKTYKEPLTLVNLKRIQAKYQVNDGKPTHLKGGFRDVILYNSTLVMCFIGLISTLHMVYQMAMPASWRTESVC